MYQYSLFLFRQSYAEYFYFKIDLLYRFLNSDSQSTVFQQQRELVLDQVKLIDVYRLLNAHFPEEMSVDIGKQVIIMNSVGQEVKIVMNDYSMDVYAPSILEADEWFFKYIKSLHPHIFVVNFTSQDYGWMLPLSKNKLYQL
ncbi:sporulation inhibitor of replication protein SirA [Halalkalibacillus sediminis]|nr:sporulation inhibitor of replication protein SirA [Halalkalibacillus sediminis]